MPPSEAAGVARSWRPDAVVPDLHGTGDPAPLARLGLPLILTSGADVAYLAAAARRLGAAAAVRKPYDLAELAAALAALAAGPAA